MKQKGRYYNYLLKQMQRLGIIFPMLLSVGYLELSLGFLPALPYAVLITLLVCCLFFPSYKEHIHVDKLSMVFLLVIPLTILLAEPRSIFRSWERFGVFALVFAFTSPLLQNTGFRRYRRLAFYTFIGMAAVIGTLSFFAYFMGVNYMLHQNEIEDEYMLYAGTFGGLTRHSMMLGPLSGLGFLGSAYLFSRHKKWYWLIPGVLCVFSVLFSASRSAFLSMIFGFIVLLLAMSRNLYAFLKKLLWIGLILGFTYPYWNSALDAVKEKQMRHEGRTELFDSRSQKVECRWNEFLSSPIYGVGFSAIDPQFKDNYGENGTIEPGSSWLGVLSMTGLLGFGFVLSLFVRSLNVLFHRRSGINILVLACISLVSVHMFVEGYIFASGNPMSFICWLLVGLGYDALYSVTPVRKQMTRYALNRWNQRLRIARLRR